MRYLAVIVLLAIVAAAGLYAHVWRQRHPVRIDPLTASGETSLAVIDTRTPFALDPVPRGWAHRRFLFTPPMQLSFADRDGVPALRCETNASGSIYGRFTDIDLAKLPILTWRWLIEVPITSEDDERTPRGDDHPARLFLEFRASDGSLHHAEIIWSNRVFKRGDWKYIGGFPHYVADGGNGNVGVWRDQRVDLGDMFRTMTKRTDDARLTYLGIFCDSDNTRTRSIAYTADVRLSAQ